MTALASGAPATVLVVDDSAAQRRFLRTAVEVDPGFSVVGEARSGREAVALVTRLRPSVVLMDLDLPLGTGLDAIERIMSAHPTPILGYSAHPNGVAPGQQGSRALEAIAAGAVDVLATPAPDDRGALDGYADVLRRRLRVCARVRVITHPRGRLRVAATGQATAAHADQRDSTVSLVAIGASTGGPQALLQVLAALPADLGAAVLVVQHMAEGFMSGLASWLDDLLPMTVAVGAGQTRLLPGTVTLAPSGANLLVLDSRLRVASTPPDPGQFHVPGIDATLHSIASAVGSEAVGVLLTGMGRDGAAGLLAMRSSGALTLGQDEATSTVYGMPAAAYQLGAVERQLPLPAIGPAILAAVRGGR